MNNFIDKVKSFKMNRRSFLKWSAATSAALMVTGYESELSEVSAAEADSILSKKGEWVSAACWHNCGGRCLNKAYVVDGVVIRQKTDDTHPDSIDFPQQRACARGRSQRKQVFGADRLKYPMKRKHWAPGGGQKELRGKDQWVRISWNEALDIVSSETTRIKESYGNQSIYLVHGADGRSGEMRAPFALYGGYVEKYGSRSRGAWARAMQPIMGIHQKQHALNDRMDILNAKLIVLWGNNPAWNSGSYAMNNLLRAKEAGIKIISIDPFYNTTASVLADEFIPIRPATDTPMLLAIAYVLITEDSPEKPLIDWDFLNRCTVGFDSEHMPQGADPKENFKDYVLGTYDNQPKTPEWASEICGTPADKIRSFANELGSTKPATVLFGWNSARIEKGQHVCLAQTTVGAMTGNMGIAGGCFSCSAQEPSTNGGPALVRAGSTGVSELENPLKQPKLSSAEHWDAILTGKYTDGVGAKKDIDVRMIYHSHSSTLNQTNNANKGIKAHRKVEFVVTNQYVLNPNAAYSDIVLPITTMWERFGNVTAGNRETLIWARKVIEPLFESKDDYWIAKELGKRWGIDSLQIQHISDEQIIFNQIAGAQVIKPDNSGYEPLVTITDDDIKAWGVEGKPQIGRITLDEFKEKGIYQVERKKDDKFVYIHNKKFRENPEENPLSTKSGKIEIHCQELADMVTKAGWNKGNPIAIYEPATHGYEATFKNWNKKIKGRYPLQLCSIHGQRQTHSVMGNVPWLREAFPYELYMNTIDAKARGFSEQDVVRVFNEHGSLLRRLHITERVMPGVVLLPQGSWIEIDDNGNCRGGSANMLTGDYPSGPDIESFQACIVDVEKYNKELEPDHKWKQRIVL
ncbi:anaerobic dimethyl sulfoxide reductase chain A [Clostridium aceticum]|uniref:Anaerobic dimethyl sulfoxide reductase chain A n=1 Tax=Clostridium aceticum TaxID=84022 RepID=A0A0D8IGX8_9CLOT|nr:molybdopterin-dependent oxidoreductase [Clostridium aceticum]AKL94355.1 anaerobic dimethyl sulfoxide reductase chain A [Clostridium aceticum]KJF28411.1 DMSO reductase [Clostridium aceticum]